MALRAPLSGPENSEDGGRYPDTPQKLRVLLVEDDAALRDLITEMLTSRGFEVRNAASVLEGLALYRSAKGMFGLVIADVMAASFNGWRLAETIRANDPDLPVVLMSGLSPQDMTGYQAAAVQDFPFLAKPFNRPQLLDAIRRARLATLASKAVR